jgi:hypothetical protein
MEAAHMEDTNAHNKILRSRVAAAQLRLLDGFDSLLDSMMPPADPAPRIGVARRPVANTFKLWRYCDASRCRRSQCCRGEPRDCLRVGIPLLPPDAIGQMIRQGTGATHPRRRSSRLPVGS